MRPLDLIRQVATDEHPTCEPMDKTPYIHDLADELLANILSFLVVPERSLDDVPDPDSHTPQNSVNGASRYGEQTDLDRFRLVCKRFMRIGTARQFSHFVLRFSQDGFNRLADFLDTELVHHVKYFTYMVRPFYQGNDWSRVLHSAYETNRLFPQSQKLRLLEQKSIVNKNLDITLLRRAISSFPALQQIKLLRLQDDADEQLQEYIRRRRELVRLDWEPACTRAIANLSISILDSNRTGVRFIGPQICLETVLNLHQTPTSTLSAVASRLSSLELNFHPSETSTTTTTTTRTIKSLTPIISTFFHATKTFSSLHLGFPTPAPVPTQQPPDLNPTEIFQNIHFKNLQTLSLQGWYISSANDLITFLRRHRHQLRNLRLLGVFLPEGLGDDRWSDVLGVLRDEMGVFERVDLSGIGYMRSVSGIGVGMGVDIETHTNGGNITIRPRHSDHAIITDDLYSFAHRPIDSLQYIPPGMTMDRLRALSLDDLEDDGVGVDRERTKLWEAWVLSGRSRW